MLFPDIPVTVLENWADVAAALQAAQIPKVAGDDKHPVRISNATFIARTIVVDTVGEFSRIIVGAIKGQREQAQLQDWGLMVERVRNVTRQLRDLRDKGFNIVFICHEQYLKQAETDLVGGYPDLPGKELPVDLPKMCDIVARIKIQQTQQGKQRVLVTEPDGVFIGRDRTGKLKPIEVIPPFTEPARIQQELLAKVVKY